MNQSEVDHILQQHRLWVLTGGAQGTHANLREAYLRDANLRDANLWGANLWNADLRGADLQNADLRGAYLRGADLQNADLMDADLQYADLRGAQLDISIRVCSSFSDAKFTSDALPWLILHPMWAEWKGAMQISGT